MAREPQSFWRRCRGVARCCRLLVLLGVLVVAAFLLYLNQAGVPRFVRERIEFELRARGLDVSLGRVRLRGFHELYAQNLQLGQTGQTNGPRLVIRDAELRLDLQALKFLQFRMQSVALHKAQLLWPVSETNDPNRVLTIDDISTELHFADPDRWELEHFDSYFLGTHLHLAASIRNASRMRSWLSARKERSAWRE